MWNAIELRAQHNKFFLMENRERVAHIMVLKKRKKQQKRQGRYTFSKLNVTSKTNLRKVHWQWYAKAIGSPMRNYRGSTQQENVLCIFELYS